MASARPSTLGELRAAVDAGRYKRRPVRDEVRDNLVTRLRAGQALFPGIIGYDDTVVPQIVNAILSRHNFILLGLRGQAKSRILRALTGLLDDALPVVPGRSEERRVGKGGATRASWRGRKTSSTRRY